MSNLDYSSPKRLFLSLISPVSFESFFSEHWEERPLHIPRNLGPVGPDGLLSLSHRTLRNVIKRHGLQSGRDVDIFRYSAKGKKESLNNKGLLSLPKYDKLVTAGRARAMFHELQRFQDELWQLLEQVESFFGTLVGSHVCVSPMEVQRVSTPPRYGDAETFVLQTEGESQWRIFMSLTPLPREGCEDISEEQLGDPTHDVLLRAGDLLYIPRGMIYQNTALLTNTHSTYLLLYTYQHTSWGDYLQAAVPSLIKDAMDSDVDFRRGLPINFLKSTILPKSSKVQSVLGILLLKLAKLRSERFPLPRDFMERFMGRRLPPFRVDPASLRSTLPGGTPPDLSCKVRLKYPEHFCFLIAERTSEHERELASLLPSGLNDEASLDDSSSSQIHFLSQSLLMIGEPQALLVFSSVLNSRCNHMMSISSQTERAALMLVLPIHFLASLETLKSLSEQFMAAASLPLDDPADQEQLIRALWSRHLLECIPGFRTHPCKSTKLD